MPAGGLRIARSRAGPEDHRDQLAVLTATALLQKTEMEAAQDAYQSTSAELMSLMSAVGAKTASPRLPDGSRVRVTMVASERIAIDEHGLRKALSAPVYDKLCDLVLNRKKLEVAIADGVVDPVLVSQHSSITRIKSSLRFTSMSE
jgi:hypothetical protein